jgi:hypothetical protein
VIPLINYAQLIEIQQDIVCPFGAGLILGKRRTGLMAAKAHVEKLSQPATLLLKKDSLDSSLLKEIRRDFPVLKSLISQKHTKRSAHLHLIFIKGYC